MGYVMLMTVADGTDELLQGADVSATAVSVGILGG